jgi:CDP-diacylglycerol---serine O-phosphatidyltransferase
MIHSIKNHLPNSLTLGNLLCGCIGIVYATQGNLPFAAYLVGLACVFDFLDGFTARSLGVSSPIGKELDSLADMVTFGVLPGFVMVGMLQQAGAEGYVPYLAFFIPVFSALRLAKFNVDTRQTDEFIGLPTPANALFICFLPFLFQKIEMVNHINSPLGLVLVTALFCFLLVSPIRMMAFKFKHFRWVGNAPQYVFAILALPHLIIWREFAVSIVLVIYCTLSVITHFTRNKT